MASGRIFYGWIVVATAWVCYGFGISPAYVSWGQFANHMVEDLAFTHGDIGGVFGLFTLLYSEMSLVTGYLQARVGIRWIMTFGFLLSGIGFFILSGAGSVWECYLGFSIFGGTGIGLATIIPCQTLGQNWFLKYRARAIAIIFTAGGVVNTIFPQIDLFMINNYSWREGWLLIMGVSFTVALLSALFIRDKPEDIGQFRDGAESEEAVAVAPTPTRAATDDTWTARQAVATPQFILLTFAGIAYALPWGVLFSLGKLHLEDVGYSEAIIAGVFSTMALISIGGRLSGSLGDIISPQLVLASALILEGFGVAGFLLAPTALVAYASAILVGLGFGAAYISIPVVFTSFFGRQAFGVTSGLRVAITGIFNALAPWVSGLVFDATQSYTVPFISLVALTVIGAAAAGLCRHPGNAPGANAAQA